MKFTIRVRSKNSGHEHDETYEKHLKGSDEAAARHWAEETLENFNNTLNPNEEPRELVSVTLHDADATAEHNWTKTSLSGQQDGDGYVHDKMRCKSCGMTAKRFGVNNICIDRKYMWHNVLKKPFRRCDTAKAFLDAGGDPRNTTRRKR